MKNRPKYIPPYADSVPPPAEPSPAGNGHVCYVKGCGKAAIAKRMCNRHYMQFRRTGRTSMTPVMLDGVQLTGTRISESTNTVLTIVCRARGISKYQLIREILEAWAVEQSGA